eukprot:TRINITY_DN484_c0_g1_i1.p1 TRINITY_DN484_c0_g1~~TRINITY_DN484_c0_g1_i1.p1  ORF type:complete len:246 (-),score=43.87 TRINITY_DN484_c0_g1_i1:17-754(-)
MSGGIQGKVVLITGASSGIGESTAEELAKRGAKVILGARRTDRLEALVDKIKTSGGTAHFRSLDVTKRTDVVAFVEYALQTHGRIDVFINNAGVMPLSHLSETKVEEWDQMIDVNIRGVLHGIAAALPLFKKQGSGHFINVSSVAGHMVAPTSSVYSATKHAVNAISEGLRLENNDIRVTIISPGATESELSGTISTPEVKTFVDDFMAKIAIPAVSVARAIAYAIEQPDFVDVSEIIIRPTAQN